MKLSRFATSILVCLVSLRIGTGTVEAREKKVPIDAQAKKFTFKDIRYLPRTLDDFGQPKAFVMVFTATGCPVVQRYLPRLKELSARYSDKGVQFIAVDVGTDDSIKEIAYQAIEHGVEFPFAERRVAKVV